MAIHKGGVLLVLLYSLSSSLQAPAARTESIGSFRAQPESDDVSPFRDGSTVLAKRDEITQTKVQRDKESNGRQIKVLDNAKEPFAGVAVKGEENVDTRHRRDDDRREKRQVAQRPRRRNRQKNSSLHYIYGK